MDSTTIFTKTAKGLGETVGKTKALSRGLRKVLKEVDGQASFAALQERLGDMSDDKLEKALSELLEGDYIREFRASEAGNASAEDDFDFTSQGMFPETLAQLTIGAYLRAVAEAPKEDEDVKAKARSPQSKDREGPATVRARWHRDAARYNEETVERAKPNVPPPTPDEKNEQVRRMEEAARQAEKAIQQREAELKARREAEAKARQEAEEKARIEAEERARQEAELKARREAEIKARREAEEKARAEAQEKARREAEERAKQQAEEKARREAEEAARKQAEEKARKEAEAAAKKEAEERARREAEEKARREAEERARRAAEEKAKKEAEAKARKEAEEKARQEAEEQARRKAEEKARREAEEKARREAEARARREAEEREKKEAEERAAREAREKAEREAEEVRRLAEEEAARRAAEFKKAQEAQERAAAEEKARLEAELQRQKELRELEARVAAEKRRLDAERAAREDAEARERLEAEQRQLRREEEKAAREAEALARKQAKEEARRKAEEEAERAAQERAKRKAEEQEQRTREQEARQAEKEQERREKEREREERKQNRSEEQEAARPVSYRISIDLGWLKTAVVAFFAVAAAGVASIPFLSFNERAVMFEKTVSAQFHQPVKIGAVRFALLPRPHWLIEDVKIGDHAQIKARQVEVNQPFGTWLDENPPIDSIEISSPVLNDESMGWILFGKSRTGNLHLGHVTASNVKWEPDRVGAFDIDADMGGDGAWKSMTLFSSDRKTQLDLRPGGDAIRMELDAQDFSMPFGAGFSLAGLHAVGTLRPENMEVSEFHGIVYEGTIDGSAKLDWSSGWSLRGEVHAKHINAALFVPTLFESGSAQSDAKFDLQSEKSDQLFHAPRAEGSFSVTGGALMGVDLVDLFKGALKGGRSAFSDFTGSFTCADGKAQLRGIRLKGGLVSAAGYADINADSNLNGHFMVDLKSDVTRAHADLAVSGTVKEPRFAR